MSDSPPLLSRVRADLSARQKLTYTAVALAAIGAIVVLTVLGTIEPATLLFLAMIGACATAAELVDPRVLRRAARSLGVLIVVVLLALADDALTRLVIAGAFAYVVAVSPLVELIGRQVRCPPVAAALGLVIAQAVASMLVSLGPASWEPIAVVFTAAALLTALLIVVELVAAMIGAGIDSLRYGRRHPPRPNPFLDIEWFYERLHGGASLNGGQGGR